MKSVIKPLIIGLSIIITALILGAAFKNRNVALDTVSVTGLGTKDFTSDVIYWTGSFSSKAMNAKDAYNIIKEEKEKVKKFFLSKGFSENEFVFGGVVFEKQYKSITISSKENGNYIRSERVFDGYTANQEISFTADKNPELMKKIENVIDQTSELINSGVEFNPDRVQYTYSNLAGLKHSLIESASKDAKERAEKIIIPAKGKMGKLKSASMGVFQITGKGEDEEFSYGGVFDIYSKEKTARITVRLQYVLN